MSKLRRGNFGNFEIKIMKKKLTSKLVDDEEAASFGGDTALNDLGSRGSFTAGASPDVEVSRRRGSSMKITF